MQAFDLLDKTIQKVLYELQWYKLHEIQEEAIQHLLYTPSDMIISAPTASGKTEAAFLPIISSIINKEQHSIKVLYISPLKSLLNDQFIRIKKLCSNIKIPITKWHGDAKYSKKQKLLEHPSGILLITPESLQSLFINKYTSLYNLFKELDYIVIDEIHDFIGKERGSQLKSLLKRLEYLLNKQIIKIGLSATINNIDDVAKWLNSKNYKKVKIIQQAEKNKKINGIVKSYLCENFLNINDDLLEDLLRVIKTKKNLIFSNSKEKLEKYHIKLSNLAQQKLLTTNFYIHHGSLSKNIREIVENNLKKENNISVFCTNTLELGIDIGNIDRIIFLDPPNTVSSTIQRLGRCGRGFNATQEFRFYLEKYTIKNVTDYKNLLYIDLIKTIAIIELMLQSVIEPLNVLNKSFSVFIQQILGFLSETGGTTALNLYNEINNVAYEEFFTKQEFIDILQNLYKKGIIYQYNNSIISLAKKGELLLNNFDFYSTIKEKEEISVFYNNSLIGKISPRNLLYKNFVLSGIAWEIIEINSKTNSVTVKKANSNLGVIFDGEFTNTSDIICKKMFDIYKSKYLPKYLSKETIIFLEDAYRNFDTLYDNPNNKIIFIFEGFKIINTLCILMRYYNIDKSVISFTIGIIIKNQKNEILSKIKNIDFDSLNWDKILNTYPNFIKYINKFDYLLPQSLLNKSYIQQYLDIEGTKRFIENLKS